MKKVVQIDKEICIGCGLCTTACHNGVIEIIDGKAEIVKKDYCDGLGLCLPDCPTNAIKLVDQPDEADTTTANVPKADTTIARNSKPDAITASITKADTITTSVTKTGTIETAPVAYCCPGTKAKSIKHDTTDNHKHISTNTNTVYSNLTITPTEPNSELMQWPVQLKLINSRADYLQGADLLVAADCTAYAYSKFHRTFIRNHITVIACPKLDDNDYNINKLTEIFENSDINTVTVVKMAVPCCGGISRAVQQAVINSGKNIPVREETISTSGELLS